MGAKSGPWTGQVLAKVIEWQLEHPKGTKPDCEAWLRGEHEAGRVRVEENTAVGKRGTVGGDSSAAKKTKR